MQIKGFLKEKSLFSAILECIRLNAISMLPKYHLNFELKYATFTKLTIM